MMVTLVTSLENVSAPTSPREKIRAGEFALPFSDLKPASSFTVKSSMVCGFT